MKEEKKLTPASRNLNSGKKKIKPVVKKTLFLFLHFLFHPLFFLSPRKADFILKNIKTIHVCFWPRSQHFLFAQKIKLYPR